MAAARPSCPLEAARPRSVRFPVAPLADESLTGLIARACAENVLGRTRSLLGSAGLTGNSTPAAAVEADTQALAGVLGVTIDDVRARQYALVPVRAGPPMMTFFGARIRATHRYARGRRVSPAALRTSPHHRALWDLKPITFCRDTWELLIEECADCGRRLGWSRAEGIASCEHCGADLRAAEPLVVVHRDRSALAFATGLLDPRQDARAASIRRLPSELASVDRGTLFELALAFGEVHDAAERDRGHDPAPAHTKLARGAEMVLRWPDALPGLLSEEQMRLAHMSRSSGAWRRFKRLMWDGSTAPEVRALLHRAYRHLLSDTRSFPVRARDERRAKNLLTAREVARRLRVSAGDVARLRDAGALTPLPVGGRARKHGWYSTADVEPVRAVLANRLTPEAVARHYGLPRPGVEQLVSRGLIAVNDDAAVRALHPGLQLDAVSVHEYFSSIGQRLIPASDEHIEWVPLAKMMRGVGGAEKPWGWLLDAVTGRRIVLASHRWSAGFHPAHVMGPISLGEVLQAQARLREDGQREGWRASHLTDLEAMEHLNCNPREFYRWIKPKLVDGTGVCRTKAAAFGAAAATTIELAARYGVSSARLTRYLRRQGVAELQGSFWDRSAARQCLDSLSDPHRAAQLELWPSGLARKSRSTSVR